jgi:hypothetical protein
VEEDREEIHLHLHHVSAFSSEAKSSGVDIGADDGLGGLAIATVDELGIMGVVMITMIAVATGIVIE